MIRRLEAAKELLADNGVIFISIDDNEVYALKLLCDEIMGEQNFVTNIIWQKKTGASDARGIATITEYILVYVKDIRRADRFSIKITRPMTGSVTALQMNTRRREGLFTMTHWIGEA